MNGIRFQAVGPWLHHTWTIPVVGKCVLYHLNPRDESRPALRSIKRSAHGEAAPYLLLFEASTVDHHQRSWAMDCKASKPCCWWLMVINSESMHFKGKHFYPCLFLFFTYLKKTKKYLCFFIFTVCIYFIFTVTALFILGLFVCLVLGLRPICFDWFGFCV